jgi:hypothetical protein
MPDFQTHAVSIFRAQITMLGSWIWALLSLILYNLSILASSLQSWRWKKYVYPKRWNLPTNPQGAKIQIITLVNTIFVTNKLFSVSDIIFYTEFKYVLSFSISRKVFKGHTVIIWRKHIFTYYISVFLHYLRSNCGWFPAVCRLWNISLEGPAVVSQHTKAPLALVSHFHVGNVLMKSLSELVTDGTKILREEV